MKKVVILFALTCVMTVCAFAQSYTVQSVKGRVQKESSGTRVNIEVGEVLSADTVIHTGVGASVVLKEGDKSFTVAAARSGKVSELANKDSPVQKPLSGNVEKTDTSAVTRATAQASTASARASEAVQEADIAAE